MIVASNFLLSITITIFVGAHALSWGLWYNYLPVLNCDSSETSTLLDCNYNNIMRSGRNCWSAGVRCSEERLRVKNVSAVTVNTTHTVTVTISWALYSGAPHKPSSIRVWCFNQHVGFILWVNNGTLAQISVGDLLSSTSFECCVSAIYYYNGYFESEGQCTSTDSMLPSDLFTTPAPNRTLNQPFTTPTSTQMNFSMIPGSEKVVGNNLNMRVSIIGGVLGSIIAVLLLLLAICGGALLFLLRSRSKR